MLTAFDTGKSILNAVYIAPENTSYEDSSQWTKSIDNPEKIDGTESNKTHSTSAEECPNVLEVTIF